MISLFCEMLLGIFIGIRISPIINNMDYEEITATPYLESVNTQYAFKLGLVEAVSVNSGILPKWLMELNPSVQVLPEQVITFQYGEKTLEAHATDYIVRFASGEIIVEDQAIFEGMTVPVIVKQ